MYARSTTIRGNPATIDDATVHLRDEILPQLQEMEGFVGLSMLADRRTGRCIATSAWADEPSMRASADRVHPMRQQIMEMFGGEMEVQEWEIAVLHRARMGDGTCGRVTWVRTDPGNLDRMIDAYKTSLMPWWEEHEGFCSNSLLVDRRTGHCASSIVFESHHAMDRTRDQFTTLREEFAQKMDLEILEVAELDPRPLAGAGDRLNSTPVGPPGSPRGLTGISWLRMVPVVAFAWTSKPGRRRRG